MVRRNLRSDFVGGAYVFPGGAVDPLDGGAEAEVFCAGRSDAEASTLLGVASGGLAYWVAVVRETFEEAGLLLADRVGCPRPPGRRPRRGGAFRRRPGRCQRRHPPLPRSVPGGAPAARRGRHPLLRALDHPPRSPAPFRHPLLRGRRAAGPDRRARRGRDDRRRVDLAPRRAGAPPCRRDRDHLPHHPQPAGHRSLRHQRRAVGGRGAGVERGADHRASAWSPTATACASCSRATRPTSGPPSRTPVTAARGDFNEAVRAVSMRANEEGPDAAPGPRPGEP